MRQDPRAICSVLLAGCLAAEAGDGLLANGEESPGRGLVAPPQLRLAQLGALDLSLGIELSPLNPQQSDVTSAPRRAGPLRVGLHRQLTEYPGDLVPRLQWVDDPHDGSVAAALTVTAPGASRVRLGIRATLPPGGAIRFFHGAPPQVVGVMDRDFLLSDGPQVRWSPSVPGSTIGLQLTLPSSDVRDATVLEIDRVAHHFEPSHVGHDAAALAPPHPPGGAPRQELASEEDEEDEDCQRVPLACTDRSRWQHVADAVASIGFERLDGSYQCSGTLLNDADENSFIPYFLTANHCISTQSEADSLEAYWFYQHDSCGVNPGLGGRSTWGGADLLATDFALDSSLLVLKGWHWEDVDDRGRQVPRFGVRFAGWDSRPRSSGPVYGVHHPGDSPKEYLEGYIDGVADYVSCNLDRRPCQNRRAGIQVSFTHGSVDGGSGGSGLFKGNRLIGVASSTDLCTEAVYGSFSEFFPRVRRWLAGRRGPDRQDGGGRGKVLVHGDGLGAIPGEPHVLVREGGSSTYSLSIEPRPTSEVKIAVQISGDGDLRASPELVRFTPENWDRPQEVTLSADEDDDPDDGAAAVAHVVTSYDDAYQEPGPVIPVSERDNDLQVSGRADPPAEAGELEVGWDAVAGAISYIVEWRTPNQEFEDCHENDSPGCIAGTSRTRVVAAGTTKTTLRDLEEDTVYLVRVTAKLDPSYGYLPSSVFSVVTLARHRPFLRGWRLTVPWKRSDTEPPSR